MIPAFLIPEAVEVWNRTGAELVERGILTDLDIGLLATYCQAVGHSMRIEQQIAALEAETPGSGYITQTRAGATIHPLQNLSQKYLQTIRLLSVELGLTPGGRTKIAKPKEPEAPHSDLDAYLKRISERKAGPHDNAV
jgi:P27 family predicted phage terminase small subunit